MDYLTTSLENIASISFHWSSDCNMACKYCYIDKDKKHMAAFNREIRESLEDGSFAANTKKVFHDEQARLRIENLSLWGAEPTINGKYFKTFIYDMLDYFPNVNEIMFSSNALLGANCIYEQFFEPLFDYAENNQRRIKFCLQLSLDGPPEFNDNSRHAGAAKTTTETMRMLVERSPQTSKYFTLELTTKPTLDVSYMRIMNQQGIECFNWYFQYFDKLQQEITEKNGDRKYITIFVNQVPTLVDPGFHTVDDGRTLAEWIHNLRYVDRNKIPTYHGPLFFQIMNGILTVFSRKALQLNPVADEWNAFSCSASKNNITIDHNGVLYTCNRLCRNIAMPEEYHTKHAMRSNTNLKTTDKRWLYKTWGAQAFHSDLLSRRYIFDQTAITMAACGQIDKVYFYNEQARTYLFFATIGLACHIGNEEDLTQNPSLVPTSTLRILGNGAVIECLKYYNLLQARGEMEPWRIVS